jgi:hypothetical protein
MCVHEEQDSTTSFGIFLTWSLWPQRTIFATGANYENLGNDKRLSVELPATVAANFNNDMDTAGHFHDLDKVAHRRVHVLFKALFA